jgi:integrase
LEENVIRIEATKFHKSRLVPLSSSVARELANYQKLRRRHGLPTNPESHLILSCSPIMGQTGFSAPCFTKSWWLLCLSTGVLGVTGRAPRLHDLRHSFAVTVLERWYRQGVDIHTKLPHLAAYMGHVCPVSTHYYLRLTPELRQAASRRFHQYAINILGGDR